MDVNEDGIVDLLSGSYSRHDPDMAGLFQILWGKEGGGFEPVTPLLGTDGEPLIIAHAGRDEVTTAICTRPFAVDWDGDQDLDLVVGNFAGGFALFRGTGEGRFEPESELVSAGDVPLKIPGVHGDPFCVDWDGDGDLDVLSGSGSGGVHWAENIAGAGVEPTLKQFEPLIAPCEAPTNDGFLAEEDLTGPTSSTRIWVDDVDGDGTLDVLVGDRVTLVGPAEGLTRAESKLQQDAWQKEYDAMMAKVRSTTDEAVRSDLLQNDYSALRERRGEFLDEQATGFVWLYRGR